MDIILSSPHLTYVRTCCHCSVLTLNCKKGYWWHLLKLSMSSLTFKIQNLIQRFGFAISNDFPRPFYLYFNVTLHEISYTCLSRDINDYLV